ncbi:MAG TPA: polyamine aminopropyltransferase, partial [Sulfurimonas sp.]|nr:polyamine aminopropyltransferase [Sulfurimonas sp.]
RDNFIYHEMMAHPALFTHTNPKNVVIVGGGDCGTLREVAKHTCLQKIIQVEIDERVTQLSKKYFPVLCEANNDSRVEFVFENAVEWVHKAESNSVDIIIVDSTDPIGLAEGLFSTPFYQACIHTLKSDGLLIQQSESPLVHLDSIIKPMHACMRNAGFVNTKLIYFPLPSYPVGWWTATMASKTDLISFGREEEV